MKKFLMMLMLTFVFIGCGDKSTEMQEVLKSGYQEYLDKVTDSVDFDLSFNVTKVSLEKIDSNNYSGYATVEFNGEEYLTNASTRVINDEVVWEVAENQQLSGAITQYIYDKSMSEIGW